MTKVIERPEADIFHNRKSYQECRDALLPYYQKVGKTLPEKERMELMIQIAGCEVVIGNIKETEELLAQCQSYIMKHGKEEEKGLVYNTMCRLYVHHSKFAEALEAGLKGLYIFKQLQFPSFTMTTSTCCGVACSNLNLFTEAIDHLKQSHDIAVAMGDPRSALLSTANLNEVRMRIMPTDEVIDHNKNMLADIYKEYGNEPSMAESATCLHLAFMYNKKKDFLMASSYIDRSLGVLSHFDYLPPHHFLYTNIYAAKAEIAGGLGDEKLMLKYAKEVSDRADQISKASPVIDINFILFRYYLSNGNPKKAKIYLDKAKSLISDADRGSQYLDLNENQCLYYETIGDSAMELHHFKLIYQYKIKAQQEGLDNRVKYLSTVHELELKNKEIQQHRAEIDFKTQELNMTTYHLQQRNQLLTDLKNNITDLKKARHKSDVIFKTITRTIEQAFVKEEVEKTRFREKFDEAHRGFIARLHQAYPALSPTECRVSALLRSGFNTKDIASLLSTTTRNVENHRVSIRRKMNLTRDENLNLVLTTIE